MKIFAVIECEFYALDKRAKIAKAAANSKVMTMCRDVRRSLVRIGGVNRDTVGVAEIVVVGSEKSLSPKITKAAVAIAGPGRCVRNQSEIVSAAVVARSLERSAAPQTPIAAPIFRTTAADSLPVICAAEHGTVTSKPAPDIVVVAADRIYHAADSVAAIEQRRWSSHHLDPIQRKQIERLTFISGKCRNGTDPETVRCHKHPVVA